MTHILVISARSADRWLLGPHGLAGLGFTARSADDMDGALDDPQSADLLLVDITETAAGLALLRALRGRFPSLPIIAMTADSSEAAAVGAFRCGAQDYLAQPFGQAELAAALHRALDTDAQPLVSRAAAQLVALELMVAGAAHELNNPLACIAGYSQLMLRDETLPQSAREDVERMLEQARQAAQIVQDLRAYGRSLPVPRTAVSMTQLVERMLELPALVATLKVERRLVPGVPNVAADPLVIQDVLLRLLGYAHSLQPRGGTLTVSTTLVGGLQQIADPAPARNSGFAGSAVLTTIHAAGAALAPADLETLFDAPRGADARVPDLSFCVEAVQDHGGSIWASSDAEQGTTLYVALPPKRRRAG